MAHSSLWGSDINLAYSYNESESERLTGKENESEILTGKRCRMRSLRTFILSRSPSSSSTKSAFRSSDSPARNESSRSMNSAAADKARTNNLLVEWTYSHIHLLCAFLLVNPMQKFLSDKRNIHTTTKTCMITFCF